MNNTFLLYLVGATLCLSLFWLAYRLFLSRLTYFSGLRFYLLGSVALSGIIPLISIPSEWRFLFLGQETIDSNTFIWNATNIVSKSTEGTMAFNNVSSLEWLFLFSYLIAGLYAVGALWSAFALGRKLWRIRQLIINSTKRREGQYWMVSLPQGQSAFSFLNYVFLSPNEGNFSDSEWQQIKKHELLHVKHRHTLDILFLEAASVFFWFNPLMKQLKHVLKELHEYQVDQEIAGRGEGQLAYARLLLKLATGNNMFSIATGFSEKKIDKRLTMLIAPRSVPRRKFRFALIIPTVLILLFLCSFLNKPSSGFDSRNFQPKPLQSLNNISPDQDALKIGEITWIGNTAFEDKELNNELGLKSGNIFNEEELNNRLNYNPGGRDVSSLYMDRGYLFFYITVDKKQTKSGIVDLTLTVHEGEKVRIGKIIINGNKAIPDEEILAVIPLVPGALFNRAKLIESQRAIADMGYFDPEEINIQPIPDATAQAGEEGGLVDIAFTVNEINKK